MIDLFVSLQAHDNQIEKVANEIGELQSLQKLNLSHNKIAQLPDGVYKLKRLTELRLGHNKIEELSDEIQNLSSLQYCVSVRFTYVKLSETLR